VVGSALDSQQRVFLHVGAPKTGTTFVQSVLFRYRNELAAQGLSYPAERYDDHFFAAVDLQDLDFSGEARPEATGTWEQVAARVRSWPGTSVVSHDVFAGAAEGHVEAAVADLAPAEVHVIFTARDLARQLPSHWQEDVKHGQTGTFSDWYAGVARHDDSDWQLRWFWRVEDVPDVLRRWSAGVTADRIHLVTVPSGGEPDLLWRRFAAVVGIEPDTVDASAVRQPNTGLGVAEVELVRRLNMRRDDTLTQAAYEHAVKGLLVHETLSGNNPGSRRFGLPEALYPEVMACSQAWVDNLGVAGYDVVGDLADLVPAMPQSHAAHPDSATDAEVAQVAVRALDALTLRAHTDEHLLSAATQESERVRGQVEELSGRLREHQELPHWERVKRTVVEIGRTNPGVGRVLGAYRRVRGR